jgi:hypothetical protein
MNSYREQLPNAEPLHLATQAEPIGFVERAPDTHEPPSPPRDRPAHPVEVDTRGEDALRAAAAAVGGARGPDTLPNSAAVVEAHRAIMADLTTRGVSAALRRMHTRYNDALREARGVVRDEDTMRVRINDLGLVLDAMPLLVLGVAMAAADKGVGATPPEGAGDATADTSDESSDDSADEAVAP